MDAALAQDMSLAEFLAWEDRQGRRYEFDGFRPVAMTGGTVAHSLIQANLLRALGNRLTGTPCRAHGSHLKVQVAGRIRYPDAFVVCTKLPPDAKLVTAPAVVFEIVSFATQREDLVVKNAEYRATPSIQRYVVLQQSGAGATVFARRGEDWVAELAYGAGAMLRMPEIGIELPLSEIYADVDMPALGDGEQ